MEKRKLKNKIYRRLQIKYNDANIERLSLEQIKFITQGLNQYCYLEACPGSGKTEVVGLKAAYEINNWKDKFNGIAIVSFTNTAAKEIENRVRKYAGVKATTHPYFIGTFDSFFYNYILYPFFYGYTGFKGIEGDFSPRTIIDERSDADFLKNDKYTAKTRFAVIQRDVVRGIPIRANKFYFDVKKGDFFILPPIDNAKKNLPLKEILQRPEQIELLKPYSSWLTNKEIYKGFIETKKNFWKDGFITFKDAEFIIHEILKKKQNLLNKFVNRFPLIIIDECQDLSPIQLLILQKLLDNGVKLFFIGDLNQAIFKFREVNPGLTKEFIDRNNFKRLKLTNNFRSNQPIVNVFSKIFPNNIKGKEETVLTNSLILIEYEEDEIPKIIKRYKEIIDEANREAKEEIIKVEKSAIIIRGATLIKKFKPYQAESKNPLTNLAYAIFFWSLSNKTTDIMNRALIFMGYFLSNVFYSKKGSYRNYYCPENYSNAEWRMFLASLLDDFNNKYFPFQDKSGNDITYGIFGKLIREELDNIISKLPVQPHNKDNINIRVEQGKGTTIINNDMPTILSQNNIRITTIHDIKGETLDSAMVVSSLDGHSQGGYWKHWFNKMPNNEEEYEYKRYGYVAFSRPKHLLVLATPKLNRVDRDYFENIGFKVENLKTRTLF